MSATGENLPRGSGQERRELLCRIPSVDELLALSRAHQAAAELARPLLVKAARAAASGVRDAVLSGRPADPDQARFLEAPQGLETPEGRALWGRIVARSVARVRRAQLGRVINATGVVLHTNLGRAPLSDAAIEAVRAVASGYSNLEYDVEAGARGSRDVHCEELLKALTGAEAALVVNNNAAAVLLVLSALAAGREVVISRGELIEIGGSFRIPDVLAQSGCTLVEVGTTNRTHLRDYARAIGPDTAALLKVHTSNYKIVGFARAVSARELAGLARERGILLIEDLGSGVLLPTERFGLAHEPTVEEAVASGADVVTFSGDKLLGGPQAGVIAGRREAVEACRRHPLARALRVDKMTLAALQATLRAYADGTPEELPLWRMMASPPELLRQRAEGLALRIERAARELCGGSPVPGAAVGAVECRSAVGGGSLPGEALPSWAVVVRSPQASAAALAAALRRHSPPVIGRVEEGALLLDLRTVAPDEEEAVAQAVASALCSEAAGEMEWNGCTS